MYHGGTVGHELFSLLLPTNKCKYNLNAKVPVQIFLLKPPPSYRSHGSVCPRVNHNDSV